MTIKIDMLRCFVAVAEASNLSDAADRLSRSVSAVSMMLKQFEDHLGKPLFETDRKRTLSPLGASVLETARRELQRFDHAVQVMENVALGAEGTVRLAAVPSIASAILPAALARFIGAHPNVQIELRDMDSNGVLDAVRQGTVDLGIATAREQLFSQSRRTLFTDRFGLICSSRHPIAATGQALDWQALRKHTFISNELCRSIQSSGFQSICQNAKLHVHNTVSLLAMVRANIGVTVLPQLTVQIESAGTVFRKFKNLDAERQIDLLFPTAGSISPAAEQLASCITAVCNELQEHQPTLC